MQWATVDDIRKLKGQSLLDVLTTGQGGDPVNPDLFLQQATSFVASRLGAADYDIDAIDVLADKPPLVVQMVVDIGVYYLASDPGRRTEDMQKAYENHVETLREIARGHATIAELEKKRAPTVGGAVTIAGPERVMGRQNMDGF